MKCSERWQHLRKFRWNLGRYVILTSRLVSYLKCLHSVVNNFLEVGHRSFFLWCLFVSSPDHICSDEARAALRAYVSEHCCYGKAVIRDMALDTIAGSNAYHVCIDLLAINHNAIMFLENCIEPPTIYAVFFINRGQRCVTLNLSVQSCLQTHFFSGQFSVALYTSWQPYFYDQTQW